MAKDAAYWRGAKARVAAFQKADPRLELVFGSKGHKYELLPPVAEPHLNACEAAHGVSIPPDYRTFLAVMGAGGAGPDYGLYDFRTMDASHVGERFPLTESHEWPEADDDPLWRLPGLMTISTSGCAIEWFIEVNGPQPGTMWVDAGPGNELMRCKPLASGSVIGWTGSNSASGSMNSSGRWSPDDRHCAR
ncbi:SMI1/KNR4 family protein [Zavarzinella formosa]|uniref:SMI1/KNR4 family protein n=1 Tax=Zavarzinella formosa TaxID=360055 RepID=UPI000496AAB3|nr:SMI1/KNR4 family protein [Zavarzinella formosa]